MKTTLLILFASGFVALSQDLSRMGFTYGSDIQREKAEKAEQARQRAEQEKKTQEAKAAALVRDPWREINGTIIHTSQDWTTFWGEVLEVQRGGIRVRGGYYVFNQTTTGMSDVEFFVANFPYEVAIDDKISAMTFYLTRPSGVYTYPTVTGGSRTVHKLDYGTVYTPPPPTTEQIAAANAAAKAKATADKKAGEERALKSNQEAADKGDAYGLLRMGERCRDGDGVEKDLVKARDYFTRAVAAGSPSAQAELDKLPK